ncbi:ABC transporter substrate-binding protein [Rhizobium sp. CSW-27]|uniref:ABC transporter substrate-binding protein n=1 Tax=Rhizobium sp. CSW-27 TaxID=2839985 RepID=UPI001C034B37|nr:ABC transporter substrate-binding protein [Rhizobium sp. CSW-27]MBT9373027.1 ABC transporter substrate-binding protein [Rhizobium sp. CSW-27]
MRRLLASAVAITAGMTAFAHAQEKTVVEFGYTYSYLFDVTFQKILPKFQAENPDIEIRVRSAYKDYEDGTNTILREAVSGNLPDVSVQGLNRQALLVEKGIAKSLEPFISKEADFAKDGYHKAMLDLGTSNGSVYGLPFAVSLPVGYYNMDLMAKAGVTNPAELPKTWDEVVDLCAKMQDAGIKTPMFWTWNITGNWFLQSLMWTQNEPLLKADKINLDSAAGLKSLETMNKLFRGCAMPNYSFSDAQKAFAAGQIAMYYTSTSELGAVERSKGDWKLVTHEFPGLEASGPVGLPAGGNAAMLVSASKDPKKLEAAWKWLKFITSGEGAADVARTTGYMPPNKAANEIILADFYKQNPNKETAVRELPLLREWQPYPGANGLAITQVLYDGIESIVSGEATDMPTLQQDLQDEVNDLMPKK